MRLLARDGWTIKARGAGERMRRPRIRFWQKVLAALVIVGVAPIALVSVVSTNNTRNDLTLLGVTNIRQRSTSTANAIDAYLASRLGDIILVAKLPDIVRYATNLGDQESRAAARGALAAAAAGAVGLAAGWVELLGLVDVQPKARPAVPLTASRTKLRRV